jgi:DNA-3-methyladenine glycosylase II
VPAAAPPDAAGHEVAYQRLAETEPVLAGLIRTYGKPDPFLWADGGRTGTSHFAAMALHIIGQQISTTVAFTIYDRIAATTGSVLDPRGVLALGADRLRACGLSRAKADYLLGLAQAQTDGTIDIEHLSGLDDTEATAALTAMRGIGLWSAQMFLVHQLQRPDVLPAGDVGIRRGIRLAWELPETPSVEEARITALPWSPYRTYAAALLWRSLRPADPIPAP